MWLETYKVAAYKRYLLPLRADTWLQYNMHNTDTTDVDYRVRCIPVESTE